MKLDPKFLALIRKAYDLDEKALPDDISLEKFEEFIFEKGITLPGSLENIKGLQKVISEKDLEIKKLGGKKDPSDPIDPKNPKGPDDAVVEKLLEKIDGLQGQIVSLVQQNQTKEFGEKYPDILPELLVGKTPEEAEAIATRQRTINKKLYGDSARFKAPLFEKEADIDEKLEEIKNDKGVNGLNSAVEVLSLNRERQNLPDDD